MANILKYKGYLGSVEFSAEDNLLVGTVIGVQDSLNFHGSSIEEVTLSFHECIDGYLEMCEAFGRSPDKVYKGSFNIRIPSDLHRTAAIMAEKDGVSLNQFIQHAIEEQVNPPQYKNIVIMLQDTLQAVAKSQDLLDYSGRYRQTASGAIC